MTDLVKVSYKGKTRRIPARYLEGLKGKDREKQIMSILDGKKRPKTSFVSKKSSWTQLFNSTYGSKVDSMDGGRTLKNIAKVTKITEKALEEVFKKGMAAYYNGGSRPNQTPESWAYARVYSYIMGGNTRKVDNEITVKYNVKFKHFVTNSKTRKKKNLH